MKELCRERNMTLKALLADAGVSRTAYYSLLRKESVLPKSVDRIARCLGVSPAGFLADEDKAVSATAVRRDKGREG